MPKIIFQPLMISNPPGAWRFFLFSYMPVTCAKHCFKGFLLCFRAVSSRPVTCQLHAGYMSYAQVTTSNSQITT